jgi:ubiquinone/menaquinone biosynthesis C-methylase UbiE
VTRNARAAVLVLTVIAASAVLAAQQRDPKAYREVLENPDRLATLQVEKVMAALAVKAGMRIADLGAGSGIFSIPLARATGPTGLVYAVDIDPGMLAFVSEKAQAASLTNIKNVVAGEMESRIPEPVDLIFICDVMHHLPKQAEYVKQFGALLRPDGRVVVIDFAEGKWPAGHESFTITPAQVDGWMRGAGFALVTAHDFLPTNFFRVYQKAKGLD